MKAQFAIALITLMLINLVLTAPGPESEKTSGVIGNNRKFNRPGKPFKNTGERGSGMERPRRPRAMGPGGHGNGGFKRTTRYSKVG